MVDDDGKFGPEGLRLDQGQALAGGLIDNLQILVSGDAAEISGATHRMSETLASAGPFPMTDVRENLSTMQEDFRAYSLICSGIPCIQQATDLIPISRRALFARFRADSSAYFTGLPENYAFRDLFDLSLRHFEAEGFEIRIWRNVAALRGMLFSSLSKFLARRLAVEDYRAEHPLAFKKFYIAPKLNASSVSGTLAVAVNYCTGNMRVHSSPAYFLNWTYYGSSPSPVRGSLPPGRYKFAGDSTANAGLIIDRGVFDIPADFSPTVIAF